MKIILMNGGLGNQLFQYVFCRYIECKTGEKCYIDDSEFFGESIAHNGYEIERIFGIKLHLLSQYFDADVWREICENRRKGIGVCQQLFDAGMEIMLFAETKDFFPFTGNIKCVPANQFDPDFVNLPGNTYYHGYWFNAWWFFNNRQVLLKELKFPEVFDPQNEYYVKMIEETCSVAVHIRRGDFVGLGKALPDNYYFNSIRYMRNKFPYAVYFLFSDDLAWCRDHAETLGLNLIEGKVFFIDGNKNNTAYVDMQLMSICKHMIVANSSFSHFAQLINKNPNPCVIIPEEL